MLRGVKVPFGPKDIAKNVLNYLVRSPFKVTKGGKRCRLRVFHSETCWAMSNLHPVKLFFKVRVQKAYVDVYRHPMHMYETKKSPP